MTRLKLLWFWLRGLFLAKDRFIVAYGDREPMRLCIAGVIRARNVEEILEWVYLQGFPKDVEDARLHIFILDDMRRFSGAQFTWVIDDQYTRRLGSYIMATTHEAVQDAYRQFGLRARVITRTDINDNTRGYACSKESSPTL